MSVQKRTFFDSVPIGTPFTELIAGPVAGSTNICVNYSAHTKKVARFEYWTHRLFVAKSC
jgi:hypothetical protein